MPINSFENYPMSWKPHFSENSNKPRYIELVDMLEADIKAGILSPGTKLPPQRELADFLDINVSTISRAFKLCEQRGWICAAVGKGTYISSDAVSNNILLQNSKSSAIIEMGAILPDNEQNLILADYLRTMIDEPEFYKLFQYGHLENNLLQQKAAAVWLSDISMPCNPDKLLFAAGGQNGIFAVLTALFHRGDRIATTPTTYPGFKLAAKALEIQLIPLTLKDNKITDEALYFAVKNENVKGFYLIPDFNNPTADIIDLETRKMIARFMDEVQLPLIEDSINSLLLPAPDAPISSFTKHGILISSMSKVLAPGLRLAVICSQERYFKQIQQSLYAMNITVSSILVSLASRLILSGKAVEIRHSRQDGIILRNRLLNRKLHEYDIRGDIYSPLRWLILPNSFNPDSFEALAHHNGVQVYSASRFSVGTAEVPNAVRIAVTAAPSMHEFELGIDILLTLLKPEQNIPLNLIL